MKFRNQFTNQPTHNGEVNVLPSMTVPDQSMSLHEILFRYSRGLGMPASKKMHYTGDMVVPDLTRMDRIDQVQLLRDLAEHNAAKSAEVTEIVRARRAAIAAAREAKSSPAEPNPASSTVVP